MGVMDGKFQSGAALKSRVKLWETEEDDDYLRITRFTSHECPYG